MPPVVTENYATLTMVYDKLQKHWYVVIHLTKSNSLVVEEAAVENLNVLLSHTPLDQISKIYDQIKINFVDIKKLFLLT